MVLLQGNLKLWFKSTGSAESVSIFSYFGLHTHTAPLGPNEPKRRLQQPPFGGSILWKEEIKRKLNHGIKQQKTEQLDLLVLWQSTHFDSILLHIYQTEVFFTFFLDFHRYLYLLFIWNYIPHYLFCLFSLICSLNCPDTFTLFLDRTKVYLQGNRYSLLQSTPEFRGFPNCLKNRVWLKNMKSTTFLTLSYTAFFFHSQQYIYCFHCTALLSGLEPAALQLQVLLSHSYLTIFSTCDSEACKVVVPFNFNVFTYILVVFGLWLKFSWNLITMFLNSSPFIKLS